MAYHGIELCKLWFESLSVEPDEGTFVAHLVAIIGSTEDCYAFPTMCLLISCLLNFMRTDQQI